MHHIGAAVVLEKKWIKAEFAYYQPGRKRFHLTRELTTTELKAFKSYLESP